MKLEGTIVELKSFYAVIMTDDYKWYKIFKKNEMKIQNKINFSKSDVLKFKLFIFGAPIVFFIVFLSTLSLFLGSNNYSQVVYIDSNNSYELYIDNKMHITKTNKYINDKYAKSNDYIKKTLSDAIIEFTKNESENEKYFSISYIVPKNPPEKYLDSIGKEINTVETWIKNVNKKDINLIINQATEADRKYALNKQVPVGKYIVYKYENMDENIMVEGLKLLSITDLFENEPEDFSNILAEQTSNTESPETSTPKVNNTNKTYQIVSPSLTPVVTKEFTEMPISNLALNKTITAMSSGISNNLSISKAVDKNIYSFWYAYGKTSDNWITLDLGSSKEIISMEFKWAILNHYPKTYTIKKGNDSNWIDVVTINGKRNWQTVNFDTFTSRYIYIELGDSANLKGHYSLYDWKVYGR